MVRPQTHVCALTLLPDILHSPRLVVTPVIDLIDDKTFRFDLGSRM